MSVALWPVFEDSRPHHLGDEGAVLLDVLAELDVIAEGVGRTPLSAFHRYVNVPAEIFRQRVREAQEDDPDLPDFPVVWHNPADAVATLDTLWSTVAAGSWTGGWDREVVLECLAEFRGVLGAAAKRGTRFNLTLA
jgi:hypothetical protein